jgi:hypothetical protein
VLRVPGAVRPARGWRQARAREHWGPATLRRRRALHTFPPMQTVEATASFAVSFG